MKRIVTIVFGLFLILHATIALAGSGQEESTVAQVGYGTGSVVGSVVYFPLKTTFCVLGGIGSIYTRIFNGPQTTHALVSSTCRGTWAITPDHLKGNDSVTFVGDVPPLPPDMTAEAGYR